MKREEKRKKFHESLLQMLYPPPPSKENNQELLDSFTQNLDTGYVPDELDEDRGSTSTSADDADEGGDKDGPKKLTRSQRKRLRKKKLKEAASHRRKIIGPLLPNTGENGIAEADGDVLKEEHEGVRGNAPEKDDCEERPLGSKGNKRKQRRIIKKLAGQSVMKPSSSQNQQ